MLINVGFHRKPALTPTSTNDNSCFGVLGAAPLGEGVMDDLLSVLMMGDPRRSLP